MRSPSRSGYCPEIGAWPHFVFGMTEGRRPSAHQAAEPCGRWPVAVLREVRERTDESSPAIYRWDPFIGENVVRGADG
jgi:hypothetical protein